MMPLASTKIRIFLGLLLWAVAASWADDEPLKHDNSRLSIFLQPAISFLSFEERDYFQDAIDTIYQEFRSQALTEDETLNVAKQNFQKVNFCFPVTGGLQFQYTEDHFISIGTGFIYDNESVVLTDRKGKTHNYSYTIQGVPLFLEYRLAIPLNFMTLSDGGLFSVAVRWYWTLPGTEIYTTWGKIEAENKPFGAGFGISAGYMFASWKSFKLYGDIGFSSISVKSKKSFEHIVPDGPKEKAKWNVGGLQLQVRASFGLWNKPAIDSLAARDSLKRNSTARDSAIATPDSLRQDSTVRDSAIATPDSLRQDSTSRDSAIATPDSLRQDSTSRDSAIAAPDSLRQDSTSRDSANISKDSSAAKTPENKAAAVDASTNGATKESETPTPNLPEAPERKQANDNKATR